MGDHDSSSQTDTSEPDQDPDPSQDSAVSRHGALRIEGSQMLDQNAAPVQLKGMSLFWHNCGGRYYTAGVVETLAKDWGSTVIRAAIGVEPFLAYLMNPQGGMNKMRTIVDAAIANGIYVVVDWQAHDIHTNDAKISLDLNELLHLS